MTAIWLRDLVYYCLQVGLLAGAGALLAQAFRFRASTATLLYWQALLGLCLILPVCQRWTHERRMIAAGSAPAVAVSRSLPVGAVPPAPAPPPRPWPVERAVLLIIAGGILIRGVRLAAGLTGLRRWRHHSAAPPAPLQSVFERTARELGTGAELRISAKAAGPVTFGFRRPLILLPANLAAMQTETQRAIVCHELLHVRRRDWAWCVAEEFIRTGLWFHPAIDCLIARIRLTREQVVDQAVIGLAASRQGYVQALLHVAQVKIEPNLIPAPLFLRRGLLKKRIAEILKETPMTTRRLILCLLVSAGALFLVARAAISLFPLQVHAQELTSSPIQVVQGNENLLRRAPLVYPRRAIERGVEGDVMLDVSVDEQGQVSDAHVLSGPEELRRACLQSVLEWRYRPPKSAPADTQVMIHFQLPPEGASSEFVLPAVPREHEGAAVRYFVMNDPQAAAAAERKMKELEEKIQSAGATADDKANYELQLAKLKAAVAEGPETRVVDPEQPVVRVIDPGQFERQADELKAKIADPGTPPEDRARLKKQLGERLADMAKLGDGEGEYVVSGDEQVAGQIEIRSGPVNGKLTRIRTERVPQATLDALLPRLGIHVGDTISDKSAKQAAETVWSFDKNYGAIFHPDGEGGVELVIVGP